MIKNKENKKVNVKLLIKPALTLAVFVIFAAMSRSKEMNVFLLAIVMFALNAALWLISDKLYEFFCLKFTGKSGDLNDPILQNITLQFIKELYLPILICSESGKIIYCNDSLYRHVPIKSGAQFPKNIEEICNTDIGTIVASEANEGVEATAFNKVFNIKGYRIEAQHSPYYITIWNERTDYVKLNKRIVDEQTVVAYILIDNLDELSQAVNEKTREASHQVEVTLKEWASEVGGIIKEFEKNKYIFVFESRYLDRFIEDKFRIREKIHEIKVGETNLSLTISIGAARFPGTLAQKENGARAALEFALKRGGDTAVYNNGNENVSFDGRVKTTSKSTQVRARMTAARICEMMKSAGNVLIMGHKNPDYDSIGACVGMARLAVSCGQTPKIIIDKESINTKLCLDYLSSDEYNAWFIDSVSAQDLVRSDSLAIVVDANNALRFESQDVAANSGKLIIIDHHSKHKAKDVPVYKTEIEYIEPYASSASELVAEFLEHTLTLGTLPPKEALLLMSGIILDTKQFTRNTGIRTFSAAQYLRSEGASPAEAQVLFESSLDDYKRSAVCAADAKIYREHFAIAALRASDNPDDKITAARVADILLDLKGVHASFAVFEINNIIHISARSAGKINVASIIEGVGGGGYYESAGAQIKDATLDQTLIALKEQIDGYIDSTNTRK